MTGEPRAVEAPASPADWRRAGADLDDLELFADWWLRQPVGGLAAPFHAVYDFGVLQGLVLFRQPPYQVELFVAPPGQEGFPVEHSHPHIDTIQLHVSGDLIFTMNGQDVATSPPDVTPPVGSKLPLRVPPGAWHGARCPDRGGFAFLALQRWAPGVPVTSAGLDWEGEPNHEIQRQQLEEAK